MILADLAAAAARALGARAVDAQPVGGGSINQAARVTLDDGRTIFVKHSRDAPPGSFRAEAEGLAWLAAPGALRTPAVLALVEEGDAPLLALEWIARGPAAPGRGEQFGRSLAALHGAGAPSFGAERDGWKTFHTCPHASFE